MRNPFHFLRGISCCSVPVAQAMVIAVVAIGLTIFYVAPVTADSIVGTWTGTIEQHPAGSSSTYPGEFTLTSPTSGKSTYPSLNCGGTLSGGESGGVYRFRETITYGRVVAGSDQGCIDGNIEMTVRGNTMTWRWSGSWQGERYVASGTLQRMGMPTASWSRGRWVRGASISNIVGLCSTTWTCRPGSDIMRSPDSQVLSTGSLRTRGACRAVINDPETCGTCVSYEPEARCEYCVQPSGCDNSSLGSRTREAMGCCPAR